MNIAHGERYKIERAIPLNLNILGEGTADYSASWFPTWSWWVSTKYSISEIIYDDSALV
jgi:hypothetical protein